MNFEDEKQIRMCVRALCRCGCDMVRTSTPHAGLPCFPFLSCPGASWASQLASGVAAHPFSGKVPHLSSSSLLSQYKVLLVILSFPSMSSLFLSPLLSWALLSGWSPAFMLEACCPYKIPSPNWTTAQPGALCWRSTFGVPAELAWLICICHSQLPGPCFLCCGLLELLAVAGA